MRRRFDFKMSDKVFDVIVYAISILFTLICLYPLYLVVINSFSDPYAVARGEVYVLPKGFSFEAYIQVFNNGDIMMGYVNSLFYTIVGTALNMALTRPAAYALSKKEMAGRNALMMLIVFTMYFSGGLVPGYILIKSLNLLNTRMVVLLGGAVVSSNLIVARTFFASAVPQELEDAARIDGCNVPQAFIKIVLPLSKAMLGVIVLYYAVSRWNNFTSSLYYQPMKPELYSLQMIIRNMLQRIQAASNMESELAEYYANIYNQIKYSIIVVASLPLMILYPFLQKYFEKGVMMGSVKG